MVISPSKSNTGNSSSIAASATSIDIGGTKKRKQVPVSTSFSGLSKPRKPRGPRTPYNFFFADERTRMEEAERRHDAATAMAAIRHDQPKPQPKPKPTVETTKARNREIAKKWRHFAQMQKLLGDNDLMKSYRAMAAEDEIRYKSEMAEYLEDVEAYNDAEAEAEEEFLQLQQRVVAEARAKHGQQGKSKKKARVEEENDSSTTTNNTTTEDDEARVQPSSSGDAGTSQSNTNKDHQEPGGDAAAAAAAMTDMASGLGLPVNRILPGRPHPRGAATVPPGAAPFPPIPPTHAAAAASPYYVHGAPPPPPHPSVPYHYPPGMVYALPPHLAHPPTLHVLMAQRAGEAAAVHLPSGLPPQAVEERIATSMAYMQGYAAACSAMVDRQQVPTAPAAAGTGTVVAPAPQPAPVQGHQQQPNARSDLETAVAKAGPVPTVTAAMMAAKVTAPAPAPSSAEEDAALLEESPLAHKTTVDKDIFVARRLAQGQKTTEE